MAKKKNPPTKRGQHQKVSLSLKLQRLNSTQLESELLSSLLERAKAHFQRQEQDGSLPSSRNPEIKVEFDKDPHDRDPHDRDPGNFDRDNFDRDNFDRFT